MMKQACQTFAKKLNVMARSKIACTCNPFSPEFWALKLAKPSFHHMPWTNMQGGPVPNYEYFWVSWSGTGGIVLWVEAPDEDEGAVPWTPKYVPTSLIPCQISQKRRTCHSIAVTPSSSKRKLEGDGYGSDQDRKPNAKPHMTRKDMPTSLVPNHRSFKR